MDLFKFTYTVDETLLENGELILGYDSVMWIERYRVPGEFEIKAKLSTGLLGFLPVGTLISHIDTYEVMIVESIEIQEELATDPDIIITGRDFSSYLENRVVGTNLAKDATVFQLYNLPANYSWIQIVQMIQEHINIAFTYPKDNLVDVSAQHLVAGTSVSEGRTIERGDLLTRVQELLAIDDLGIRTIRRNTFGVIGSSTETYITLYVGVDKSQDVIFSYDRGDIQSAGYLFTLKGWKNAAVVTSRWYNQVVMTAGLEEYDRRYIHVDASDLDSAYSTPPADIPGEVSWLNRLQIRGREALAARNKVEITGADISPMTQQVYRRDFNLGDLVTLDGNYGANAIMRVVEYTEIQDKAGESGHPTLELPR